MSAMRRRRKAIERRNAWKCDQCQRWLTTPEDIRTGRWTGLCVSCQAESALRNLAAEMNSVRLADHHRAFPLVAPVEGS